MGVLRCAICGTKEGDGWRISYHIDHIWPVEDGGPEDDSRFTLPLCSDCHVLKGVVRAKRLHAIGRSAREGDDHDAPAA
jgi:hypothetical protein